MLTTCLIIILFIVTILYISQTLQLKRITKQLKDSNNIRVSLNNSTIENLALAINTRIKDYRKKEININKREEKLKESISNISHDLRTPLTSIQGYLTLLKDSNKDDEERYLKIIELKSNSLQQLINDFYQLSMLEDNNLVIETYPVDIVSVITENIISNYTLFTEKNITPIVNLPNDAIFVIGEEMACERIIQNLIANSIKYSSGEILINLKKSEDECVFTIGNTVNDIDKIEVDNMFDRFYIADKSRRNGGTGLGLYIVKTLLGKIEGRVIGSNIENNAINISIAFKGIR